MKIKNIIIPILFLLTMCGCASAQLPIFVNGQTPAYNASNLNSIVNASNLNSIVNSLNQSSLNVKDFGAVGNGITDDTLAIQNAFNTLANNSYDTVIMFPSGRYLCGPITLPCSPNGYKIEGVFSPTQNSLSTGSVIVAKRGITAGSTIWKLDNTQHSNGIQIVDLGFDTYDQNVNMVNLSQPELAATFLIENCFFMGNSNMTSDKYLLNIDGDENTVISRTSFTPVGSSGDSVLYHISGGCGDFSYCQELEGNIKAQGLLMTFVGCCLAGPVIQDRQEALDNLVFIGSWFESHGGTLIPACVVNNAGNYLRVTVLGGRWNQEKSLPFFSGSTDFSATCEGVIFASNDAKTSKIIGNGRGVGSTVQLKNCQLLSNVVLGSSVQGFGVSLTPAMPASNTNQSDWVNIPVDVIILTPGNTTGYTITDTVGNTITITTPLYAGMTIHLEPGDKIKFTYTKAPTWKWYGITK